MTASTENPTYSIELHANNGYSGTQLYYIRCDEGWRTSIVCERMYLHVATWLLDILQGKPFAVLTD